MIGNKKIACVIPARLNASRFPRKLLSILSGKPLLQWAWEGACRVPFFDEVVVAGDSEELGRVIESCGGRYISTSVTCANGTERLVELYARGEVQADVWVNWQGDEPFLSSLALQDLLQSCEDPGVDVWTLKVPITDERKLEDPSCCKVVCDSRGRALYFSRSPIPYVREGKRVHKAFQHVGLYAYASKALAKIATFSSCDLEQAEQLEQLRFLYHGLSIQVHETEDVAFGIDKPEHLVLAEEYVQKQGLLTLI